MNTCRQRSLFEVTVTRNNDNNIKNEGARVSTLLKEQTAMHITQPLAYVHIYLKRVALDLLMVHMVLACGKILVGAGLLFLATFYMILGMGLG